MIIFNLLYNVILFLIISRFVLSYLPYNYSRGQFANFVFKSTEMMLAPIRKILPNSSRDYSAIVLLITLYFLKNIVLMGVPLLRHGYLLKFILVIPLSLLNVLMSINFFLIIVYIIKLILVKTINNPLLNVANAFSSLTVPLENFIFRNFTYLKKYYRHKEIVMIIIFILLNVAFSNIIKYFILNIIYS